MAPGQVLLPFDPSPSGQPLALDTITDGGPVRVVLHAPVIGRSCSPALCSRPGQFWPCEALARPWDSSLAFKANLARYSAPVEILLSLGLARSSSLSFAPLACQLQASSVSEIQLSTLTTSCIAHTTYGLSM